MISLAQWLIMQQGYPELTQFSLNKCLCLTGEFLSDITGHMLNLERLLIGIVDDTSGNQLRGLILGCPNLKHVKIRGYYDGMLSDIEFIITESPRLNSIHLDPWCGKRSSISDDDANEMYLKYRQLFNKFPDCNYSIEAYVYE